jgi:hypothetical protein
MAKSVLVKVKMTMVQVMRLVRAKAGMTEGQTCGRVATIKLGDPAPFGNDR